MQSNTYFNIFWGITCSFDKQHLLEPKKSPIQPDMHISWATTHPLNKRNGSFLVESSELATEASPSLPVLYEPTVDGNGPKQNTVQLHD